MSTGTCTSSLIIDRPDVHEHGLSTVIRFHEFEEPFAYRADRPVTPAVGDVLLCATLLPAMAVGGDLHIPAPVSATLMENVDALQRVFSAWVPRSTTVRVIPDEVVAMSPRGERVATLFSGGADSFFTLLRNLDRIDTLVFLQGFDIPAEKPRLAAAASAHMRGVAAELGKDLVEIEISGREFTGRSIDGVNVLVPFDLYHGSLLASVAHVVAGQAREVLLPASMCIDDLRPWGSHPLTDALWSSTSVEIVHDGHETDRAAKVQWLAGHDVALRNLRVCYANPEQQYNCGRCRKCVWAMIMLQSVGALGRCTTLPKRVDPDALGALDLPDDDLLRVFTEYHLRALESCAEPDQLVVEKLRSVIGDYHRRQAAKLGS